MRWNGDDEWRVRWYSAPRPLQHRVRAAVRGGYGLADPSEAALAVGLALSRLTLHRWTLLAIPWLGGLAGWFGMAALGGEPAAVTAIVAGVTIDVWVSRLLFTGPRLRRAYQRNLRIVRRTLRAPATGGAAPWGRAGTRATGGEQSEHGDGPGARVAPSRARVRPAVRATPGTRARRVPP
jgi:hypothetical protein